MMMSNYLSDATVGAVVQARDIRGDVYVHARPALRVTPRQLPRGPARLVDRRAERNVLDGVPADATILITGPGGSGKSTLALAWLHQNADRYPDGQLFADLRGYSGERPTPPERVLGEWLRTLGVAPEQIPVEPEECAGLFRSLTCGRRFAVLIENAASTVQVLPLLPGPGCLAVVTTRRPLGGLLMTGASLLPLGPLDEPSCLDLLDLIIGPERREAETGAARALVRACGRLPLAVCLTAAALATHPDWPIARLARDLLPDSDSDDGGMTESFDSAYRALPDDETRRTYRLAAYHPGLDISPDDAAALTGRTIDDAAVRLEHLAEARLLDYKAPGRYVFGDLAFDHARSTGERYGAGDDPLGALIRLAYRKLRMAAAAHQALMSRWRLSRVFLEPPVAHFTEATALQWLETERHNLLAIVDATQQRGLHAVSWQIAEAVWPLFPHRRHYGTWITIYETGYKAARAAGDLEAQARMLQGQASAWLGRHNYSHAAALANQALELARLSGHRHAEGTSLEQLGLALLGQGNPAAASDHFNAARRIYHDLDDTRGAAIMTRHLGEAALAAEDDHKAIEYLADAEAWFARQPNEGYLRSRCLGRLGRAYRRLSRHQDALEVLETALELARTTRAHQQHAEVLVEFADLAHDMGKTDLEQRHLREAHAIYEELGAPEAATVADRLLPQSQ